LNGPGVHTTTVASASALGATGAQRGQQQLRVVVDRAHAVLGEELGTRRVIATRFSST
jgi:hypothetical protein